jgi:hypothetical protein
MIVSDAVRGFDDRSWTRVAAADASIPPVMAAFAVISPTDS